MSSSNSLSIQTPSHGANTPHTHLFDYAMIFLLEHVLAIGFATFRSSLPRHLGYGARFFYHIEGAPFW